MFATLCNRFSPPIEIVKNKCSSRIIWMSITTVWQQHTGCLRYFRSRKYKEFIIICEHAPNVIYFIWLLKFLKCVLGFRLRAFQDAMTTTVSDGFLILKYFHENDKKKTTWCYVHVDRNFIEKHRRKARARYR